MASCNYCGRKVSSDAEFCPGCGKKKPGEPGCLSLIVGGVIILGIISALAGGGKNDSSSTSSSSTETSKPQSKWEIER